MVNLAVGLNKGGFTGTSKEMRDQITEVGKRVASYHIKFVKDDFVNKIGDIPGRLSLKQMADYHKAAFKEFNIPGHFYGGTWLDIVPDEIEFKLYGDL